MGIKKFCPPMAEAMGRASGKRGIDIIQVKKITPVLRSHALSTMQPRSDL